MRRSADFEQAVRRGARYGTDTLVVHLVTRTDPGPGPVVGFVVSKAVGGAVVRNRTKRRLRAIVADRLTGIPTGLDLVVRANPPAAAATYGELAGALDPLLHKVIGRLGGAT